MKILSLTSENFKRLTAVAIKPTGHVVQLSGKNGSGKTSVLDAIQDALGGETEQSMPVRRGEERSKTVVELGDKLTELVVKRTHTAAGGSSLVVTNADGVKQLSPQGILDKLTGTLTFDPLAFANEKPVQQADTLRRLVGLDFTEADQQRAKAFELRTTVNREAKALESQLAAVPRHDGLPDTETSTADVLKEQEEAAAINSANDRKRSDLVNLKNSVELSNSHIEDCEASIIDLEAQIKALETKRQKETNELITLKKSRATAQAAATALEAEVDKLQDKDLSTFKGKIAEMEATNTKIRSNRQREELVKRYKAKKQEAEDLTAALDKFDSEKRHAILNAKYPVEGLAFDDQGQIRFNGIPFAQASTAEQLKVSVAIGIALNPKLRVLLIRHGNDLDADNLKIVAQMAEKADCQVWLERVAAGGEAALVIEDGSVISPPDDGDRQEDKP